MLAPSCFVPIPPFFQRQMCEFLVDESIDISFFLHIARVVLFVLLVVTVIILDSLASCGSGK